MINDATRLMTRNDELTVRKVEAASKRGWETGLNAEDHGDAKCNFHSVQEQQMEAGPASKEANDSIPAALQEVLADGSKSPKSKTQWWQSRTWWKKLLSSFCRSHPHCSREIQTMVYDDLEQVILDPTRTAVLDKTICKHVDKYFKAAKAVKALDKNFALSNFESLASMASFVQTTTMDAIADKHKVGQLRFTYMATMPIRMQLCQQGLAF